MKKSIELLCETANISEAVSFVSEFLSNEKVEKTGTSCFSFEA